MHFFSMIMLGLAVSIDGFGVGFAYGLRRLRIPLYSLFIICLSSALSVFISMEVGSVIAGMIHMQVGSVLGGTMLVGVGFLIIRQALGIGVSHGVAAREKDQAKGFSLLSSVLKEPSLADIDSSGVITGKEAVLLGLALAMDAFGAGFGAAMMGFNPMLTSVAVGATKLFLLSSGIFLGRRCAGTFNGDKAAVLAGVVLMAIGLGHLLTL